MTSWVGIGYVTENINAYKNHLKKDIELNTLWTCVGGKILLKQMEEIEGVNWWNTLNQFVTKSSGRKF